MNGHRENKKLGWLTTSRTKPLLVDALEEGLRKNNLKLASAGLLSELMVYSYADDGCTGAQPGYNDDLVIAIGIAWAVKEACPTPTPPDYEEKMKWLKQHRRDVMNRKFDYM